MINNSIPREFDINPRVNMRGSYNSDWDDINDELGGSGNTAAGVTVNQYIYANETDYAAQQKQAATNFKLIARTV